ncbi:Competence protein F homolog, phosphoribosyltransferase domain; protein YhgH required for utilization of DNA as sole source of carbon and energy [hydrothermal vent metagenome]|uniref:Competence protein F homolog, phosphoribosyltransferase domain protein YhgH required for utilization of DNA as sole source of carbon and energy n=1 Tax=hydrothermal vent metagenome TaxID=652676 RepID=A0A3B0XC22_9ZZZZ
MNILADFLFPARCLLCGATRDLLPDSTLCVACSGDLLRNIHACSVCASPLAVGHSEPGAEVCGQCMQKAPVYDRIWSPFCYAQPLEWMIQQLKFSARLSFASLLSDLIIQQWPVSFEQQPRPEAIIPMPLHPRRLKQRGFNQALLLVKPLAKRLNLPVDTESCRRIRNTAHQTGKNARQRVLNIKDAFRFENQNNYQHVVIFDDVVTTGSSVSELSKIIKQAGVKRVDVWCLARA